MKNNTLTNFAKGLATKQTLMREFGEDLHNASVETPAVVQPGDVVSMIMKYMKDRSMLPSLLEWVNIVWFTDLFAYDSAYENAIASVMTALERLDEEPDASDEELRRMIDALMENREYVV